MQIHIQKTQRSKLADFDFNNIPFGTYVTDHMLVAEYENGVWHDWKIIPYQGFNMDPLCNTIQYSQSIFEGMKATILTDGTPVLMRPDLNITRFNKSAERMCMPTIPQKLFLQALKAIVDCEKKWIPKGKGKSLYIRPTLYATGNYLGVKPSDTYRFVIFTMPSDLYFTKPVKLTTEKKYVRAFPGGIGEAKTGGNYAASLYPAQLANKKGYDQIIWLEAPRFQKIQEVGAMNLFFVINNKVITPSLSGAILRGTTRQSCIEILNEKGIPIEVRDIFIEEVIEAHKNNSLQEAFGVGTAAVVSEIIEINHGVINITLPKIEDRKISKLLYQEIEGLRSGEIEDTRNWMVPVTVNDHE
ncbi:branched-chain amino acid aminotransferase [Tenacibaculum xiamenense]|uniref:branched-chain amino acid aminotransferase n=1 Tax=Tenacibaculum xiamenense TaxID=1261553 RepID=UPI00389515C7